jgi:hypothetical protein
LNLAGRQKAPFNGQKAPFNGHKAPFNGQKAPFNWGCDDPSGLRP